MSKEEIKIGYFFIYNQKSYIRKTKNTYLKIDLNDTFELIDSNRKWKTGSFVKMGFYTYVIVGKRGVLVDLKKEYNFNELIDDDISMIFDRKGKGIKSGGIS